MHKKRIKPNYRRRVLRLPDLDHCKLTVLNSLGSPASRRVYEYAIDQFIAWYCSEPRLAFNRIVVVRYRMYLESRHLAANTINQQLAAVRRLAHEAADAGLLSPELAAGISRVKGVKQLGFRSGNWLSAEQSSQVLQRACGDSMRAKRDYAMLAMLFGCGFRRSKLVGLELDDIQMRQGHWAVVDLIGKGGHIRTHRFTRAVSMGNPREFLQAEKEDQEMAEACKRLIKNCIICWNYLYLSQKLEEIKDTASREVLLDAVAHGSAVAWCHLNLLGEYDFSEEKLRDSVGIRLPKLTP